MPVDIYVYNSDNVEVCVDCDLHDIDIKTGNVYWIRVMAPTEEEKRALIEHFELDPLSLEDYEEGDARPKIEHYRGYDYIVLNSFEIGPGEDDEIISIEHQINIFYYENVVITIQKERFKQFDKISELIVTKSDFLVRHGADYLVNLMLDMLVDSYYPIIDQIDDAIEDLEDEVEEDPRPELLERLNDFRRILINARRIVRPERDVVKSILKETHAFFTPEVMKYFRDIYDHLLSVLDLIESNREFIFGIRDTYRSAMDTKMNAIMKTLTVVSAIILPLTLITGIYGMNFQYMPELQHPYGYLAVLFTMIGVVITLLLIFKKVDWL